MLDLIADERVRMRVCIFVGADDRTILGGVCCGASETLCFSQRRSVRVQF